MQLDCVDFVIFTFHVHPYARDIYHILNFSRFYSNACIYYYNTTLVFIIVVVIWIRILFIIDHRGCYGALALILFDPQFGHFVASFFIKVFLHETHQNNELPFFISSRSSGIIENPEYVLHMIPASSLFARFVTFDI